MIKQLSCFVVVILMMSCHGKYLNSKSLLRQISEYVPLVKHNGSPSATKDVTSCYTGIAGIGPVTKVLCSSGASACMTFSYDYTAGGSLAEYMCGATNFCTPAAQKMFCDNILLPVTNCTVKCCSTDNCNVPKNDVKPAMGKYLGFDLPQEDRQF